MRLSRVRLTGVCPAMRPPNTEPASGTCTGGRVTHGRPSGRSRTFSTTTRAGWTLSCDDLYDTKPVPVSGPRALRSRLATTPTYSWWGNRAHGEARPRPNSSCTQLTPEWHRPRGVKSSARPRRRPGIRRSDHYGNGGPSRPSPRGQHCIYHFSSQENQRLPPRSMTMLCTTYQLFTLGSGRPRIPGPRITIC
jgi:hypothetical protein